MMTQPQLGKEIARLRKQRHWTQEVLAEKLSLNPRSVQRLEAGETEPRANTISHLQTLFGNSFEVREKPQEDLWLILMHLSSVVPIVIVPVVIWVWKRSGDSRIDYQAIDVINFQITMWLAMIVAGISVFYLIGLMLLPIIGIFICVVTLKNTLKVAQGQSYHYPYTLKILKRQF